MLNPRILKRFDEKSQNYKIRKYCKNIGMQKSTLEKILIIPRLSLSLSVSRREKYFYEKRL